LGSEACALQRAVSEVEHERFLLVQQQQLDSLQATVRSLQQQLQEAKSKIAVQEAMLNAKENTDAPISKEIPIIERCPSPSPTPTPSHQHQFSH
jgi:chromosome segregation ATPase